MNLGTKKKLISGTPTKKQIKQKRTLNFAPPEKNKKYKKNGKS